MEIENTNVDLPVLIGQTGPLNGQRWLIGQVLTIGRDIGCDIVVPHRQVSRFHARLTPSEMGVLLEDLASKNGTYCNGQMVTEPIFLQDGDSLQIALIQNFVFLSSDSTMPVDYSHSSPVGRIGRLVLDERSRRVWIGASELVPPLSAAQFRLLQVLYQSIGQVIDRDKLVQAIWGEGAEGVSEQALDALVRRLRERLAAVDSTHEYIVTVRGHGLRLDNPFMTKKE